MSRNFENEYREFLNDEVPDLWSRIEGNLKEKELVSDVENTDIITMQKAKEKKITSIYMKKYAVAACLCLVILVGGVVAVYKGKTPGRKLEMMATNQVATDEAWDWEMEEDAAPMDEMMDDVELGAPGMEDSEMMESEMESEELSEESSFDAGAEQMALREENVEANKNQINSQEFSEDATPELNNKVQLDAEETEQVSEEASEEAVESMVGSVQAVVKITSIENTGEETLYYAQVLPSVYSALEPGTEIVICIGDFVVSELKIGEDYTVYLEQPMETELTESGVLYMLKQVEAQAE